MTISGLILKLFRWRVSVTAPDYPRCIICVAPHTSNWDFVLGKLAYASVHRKAGFLMKKFWFFFPLGLLLKAIGGIPVDRKRKGDLVKQLTDRFDNSQRLTIAITPEGTRSRSTRWHTGFLRIAMEAKDVKILLGAIDYSKRLITVDKVFSPSGNIEEDLLRVKEYYRDVNARFPEKFAY